MSGFLAGVAQRSGVDFRQAGFFVGTSAGSVVAARLAAGVPPRRPGESAGPAGPAGSARLAGPAPAGPVSAGAVRPPPGRFGRLPLAAALPVADAALRAARPGRAFARAALLARLPPGHLPLDGLRARIAELGPRFDGRLRVVAVDLRGGNRVVFGAAGGPDAEVADAVAASCAVPGLFRPVRIGSRDYVDGGVWSPTNLDVAPVRAGSRMLCLVPTAALAVGPASGARALARGWQVATAVEAAGARRRGAKVTIVQPDAGAGAAMGADLMDERRREQVTALAFAQGQGAVPADGPPGPW
jgi:NTE family protein